jgi:hypothetical protein
MLLIGNPNVASGAFYESHRAWPASQRFHISAYDTPEEIIQRSWIEARKRDWGEDSPLFQVRVLGNFPALGEGMLFSLLDCEQAQERAAAPDEEQPVEIGVDLAAGGGDECVLYARQGGAVVACDYWRNPDTIHSAGRIMALARAMNAKVVKVDDIGVGKGAADHLHRELIKEGIVVSGINVGETARDSERFFNKRSELFWALSERFKAGAIAIPKADDLLVDQLTRLEYRWTSRGQVKLISKDEMKKNRSLGARWRSPDRADALMLAFAASGPRFKPISPAAPVWEPRW